jgi:hypothetical protein
MVTFCDQQYLRNGIVTVGAKYNAAKFPGNLVSHESIQPPNRRSVHFNLGLRALRMVTNFVADYGSFT